MIDRTSLSWSSWLRAPMPSRSPKNSMGYKGDDATMERVLANLSLEEGEEEG
ncbi:hypothetical protein Gohar_025660 [Gossypium harknessii]|uniref:Uncharacterized protein n=1 Tax=Gossypium harknessii TaxID=34285 RepID=A0A7J9IA25_9ROSI|nr:hypothetical protein [Gossypium harknessii]